jgi:drug/metabolite transporter (DMT)-like permease
VLFFNLGPIAMMGSAAFLLIYAAVNVAHLRVRHETGANPVLIWLSGLTCSGMFIILCFYILRSGEPAPLIALAGLLVLSFVGEFIYRSTTGRTLARMKMRTAAEPAS